MTDGSREDVLRRRKIRRRLHYLAVTGSIIAVCFAVWALLWSDWFRIRAINAQVRDDLNQGIAQDAWNFIDAQKPIAVPKTNALLLNRGMLNATLVGQFPEMRNFQFVYNVPERTLFVRATPRETAAILCEGQAPCYAMDDHAIPFKVQDASTSRRFLEIMDQSGLRISLGTQAIPDEYFEALIEYWNAGQSLGVLTNAVIEPQSLDAGYIRFDTSQGWYLLVKTNLDPESTYAKVLTVLKTEIKNPAKISYIDARYTDKVYYK